MAFSGPNLTNPFLLSPPFVGPALLGGADAAMAVKGWDFLRSFLLKDDCAWCYVDSLAK